MAVGLLMCQGDPWELSQTVFDIVTYKSDKPKQQRISQDNETLCHLIDLIFKSAVIEIAQEMRTYLQSRHNIDNQRILQNPKATNAFKVMYSSEKEPVGFIKKLF